MFGIFFSLCIHFFFLLYSLFSYLFICMYLYSFLICLMYFIYFIFLFSSFYLYSFLFTYFCLFLSFFTLIFILFILFTFSKKVLYSTFTIHVVSKQFTVIYKIIKKYTLLNKLSVTHIAY